MTAQTTGGDQELPTNVGNGWRKVMTHKTGIGNNQGDG
jgi:hypothetical protein